MPLRLVVGFRIGPAFGGFRVAFRPGILNWRILNWPEGFDALEKSLAQMGEHLTRLSPDKRLSLLRGEQQPPATWVPRLGDREGTIEVTGHQRNGGDVELVLRASFPFHFWPLGEWVVYDGLRICANNRSESFSDSELMEVW